MMERSEMPDSNPKDAEPQVGEADWRAVVNNISDSDGGFDVALTFYNLTLGLKFVDRVKTHGDLASLIAQARTRAYERPDRDARKSEIVEGMELDLSPAAPPEVIPPTPEEVARAAFFDAWAKYERAVRFSALGVDADALLNDAAKLFKPEYV
jgi:hypothetical protein